ncbi:hypothetical protein [Gillisia limnaea]|uniref:Lipoprotein n=1 Tax=Gillisia limnaea (strain DSM 15749 / LMG 21470 / R-8282) TaxID=865937 RepID=H2BZZ5_GILLR|nr:hypothetical protein [Gillisia limnaea]EHQ02362.1 hypothetical protein Gilli_1718 [Gillisia limnaea DSM 15749]
MKTNFTIFPRKYFKFLALALFSLLLVNCSKNDDDGPEIFEFKEFENLSELPEVDDPEPEFTEPNLGSVEDSEATKAMIADFQDESGDLSQTTKDNITAVGTFSDGLTTDIQDEAQALDAAKIEEILNGSELSGDYAALAAELETLPAEVAALFPSIAFSDDYNRAQEQNKAGVVVNDLLADLVSQSGTGTCNEVALASYNAAMEAPIAKRDEQLAIINANYDARVTAANSRFDDRTAALNAMLEENRTFVANSAIAILTYAESISDTDADLAMDLREFALLYVVKSTVLITTFEAEATSLLEDTLAAELARVETIKVEKTALIQSNFAAVKAEADALLTAAYAKCHNQGSGS